MERRLHYHVATIFRDCVRDYVASEKHYLECVELCDAKYTGSYGCLLYLMGRYDEAERSTSMYAQSNDEDPYSHFYHGLVLRATGNDQNAEEYLRQTVVRVPKNEKHIFLRQLTMMQNADGLDMEFHRRL